MSTTKSAIWKLVELGQSPWYDNLTRALARGGLDALVANDGIRGVTSNPTIFEKAMGHGTDYDEQFFALLDGGSSVEDAYWTMAVDDVRDACDRLAGVHRDAHGADGFVSLEVSPALAHDTAGTIRDAAALHARVDRPNLMIKIPATIEGLPAITATLAAGINVNVTLIFSLDRYAAVIDAYEAGLQQYQAAGGDVATLHSVASFFVSRVDSETDKRLPDGDARRGRAAVANAKLAYALFQARVAHPSWRALADAGAHVQRPLWASTSTKNPAYSPTLYVDDLVGPDTVNTLAQASVDALQDHDGLRAGTVCEGIDDARALFASFAETGLDFDDVTSTLEREGVESFGQSYRDALGSLASKAAAR